jgi:hypothetical protein
MNDNEVGRSKRIKAVASVSAAIGLLSGGLLFAEHDASARTVPRQRPSNVVFNPTFFPTAPPAPQLVAPNASDADVLAAGQNLVNGSTAGIQPVTAGQTLAPTTQSAVCPTLLANQALVSSNFSQLRAGFPNLTGALATQQGTAVGAIRADQTQFGCLAAVPSAP